MPKFHPGDEVCWPDAYTLHLDMSLVSVGWEPYPIKPSPGRDRLRIRIGMDASQCSRRVACTL